jgi:hypothetical protein
MTGVALCWLQAEIIIEIRIRVSLTSPIELVGSEFPEVNFGV